MPDIGSAGNSHYLDQNGCSYGQVTRARLENVEASIRGVNNKLWTILLLVIGQLVGTLAYLVIQK